jgi:hypothetical protein
MPPEGFGDGHSLGVAFVRSDQRASSGIAGMEINRELALVAVELIEARRFRVVPTGDFASPEPPADVF